jgi:hypothetical protein
MASKYVEVKLDISPYADRDLWSYVVCGFVATDNQRSYRARSCNQPAMWQEAYERADGVRVPANSWGTLRCDKHRASDERTAARSIWRRQPLYLPFSAQGKVNDIRDAAAREAKVQADEAAYEAVRKAARTILKHIVLTETSAGLLRDLSDDHTRYAWTLKSDVE